MAKLIRLYGWMLLAVILCAPAASGQQTGAAKNDLREQPVPADAALLSSGGVGTSALDLPQAPTAEVSAAPDDRPDDRPLSGVQDLTLVPNVGVRNFLAPSVDVVSQLGLNSSPSGFDRPTTSSYLLGTLDLSHVSDRSQLLLRYTGGGMFSNYGNSAVQDLDFS